MYKFDNRLFEKGPNSLIIDCICNGCNTVIKRSVLAIKHDIRHGVENVPCPTCKKANLKSKNTKTCKQCNKTFYHNTNVFCTQSCAATYNNRQKTSKTIIQQSLKPKKKCINCGNDVKGERRMFCCSKCSAMYRKEQKIIEQNALIELGQPTASNLESNNFNYKQYLIRKHGPKCMKCGWSETNPTTGRIPIELEHKDGNCINNSLDNLELLCPNCHSLSPFYKGANKRKDKKSPRYEEWKKYFSN